MELASRKQLRLKNFDYQQCNAYFVTVCIHERQHLFGTIVESDVGAALRGRPNRPDLMIEKWLLELEHKFPKAALGYHCIMPDHIHFIVFLKQNAPYGLPDMLGWFKTMTTNEYIRGVKAGLFPAFQKRFWQRNYFEHVIRNEADLYETRKYIENNPRKWLIDRTPT